MRLATASRCWRNRRTTIWVWLRDWTVNSRSTTGLGWAPVDGAGSVTPWALSVIPDSWSARRSAIPDPRVEHAVEQVGDEVEDDDHHAADHQPGQHDVGVVV